MKPVVFAIIVFLEIICLGGLFAQAPHWGMALTSIGSGDSDARCIAADGYGNVYIAGVFRGYFQLGSLSYESYGPSHNEDIFVAKLNSDGQVMWMSRAGGTGWDGASSIAVDESGCVYVCGSFAGLVQFGNIQVHAYGEESGSDLFVAKLDNDGNWLWAKHGGDIYNDYALSLCLDNEGNILVTGTISTSPVFGDIVLPYYSGDSDFFVAKLSESGTWLWAIRNEGVDWDYGYDVSADNSGNVYVTGSFRGTISIGGFNCQASGISELFVLKTDPNGTVLWVKVPEGGYDDDAYDITCDNSGGIIINGCSRGDVWLDEFYIPYCNNSMLFIAKLDENGDFVWVKTFIGESTYSSGIETDETGNIYFGCTFFGNIEIDGSMYVSTGSSDFLVGKLDSYGNTQWAVFAGGLSHDGLNNIALSTNSDLYACGHYFHDLSLGQIVLNSPNDHDNVFLSKLTYSVPVVDELNPGNFSQASTFQISPNPIATGGELTIRLGSSDKSPAMLSLFNLKGQCIRTVSLEAGSTKKLQISQDVPAGMYLLKVKTDLGIYSQKVIITH